MPAGRLAAIRVDAQDSQVVSDIVVAWLSYELLLDYSRRSTTLTGVGHIVKK